MNYFQIFFKKLSRVWTNNTISLGNFEEIFKFFEKNSIYILYITYFWERLLPEIEPSEKFSNNIFFRFGGFEPP